jgi:hypothetical protein
MTVKQPGLRGELNAAQVCVVEIVLVAFLAWTIPSRCFAFLLAACDGQYWRDSNNNSFCDGNNFIFATHRISSGSNGLQDRQCFSWHKIGRKRRRERMASKGREAMLFVFLLLVCLPHRNFAPTGIHKLSDFTHHFLGKR